MRDRTLTFLLGDDLRVIDCVAGSHPEEFLNLGVRSTDTSLDLTNYQHYWGYTRDAYQGRCFWCLLLNSSYIYKIFLLEFYEICFYYLVSIDIYLYVFTIYLEKK